MFSSGWRHSAASAIRIDVSALRNRRMVAISRFNVKPGRPYLTERLPPPTPRGMTHGAPVPTRTKRCLKA